MHASTKAIAALSAIVALLLGSASAQSFASSRSHAFSSGGIEGSFTTVQTAGNARATGAASAGDTAVVAGAISEGNAAAGSTAGAIEGRAAGEVSYSASGVIAEPGEGAAAAGSLASTDDTAAGSGAVTWGGWAGAAGAGWEDSNDDVFTAAGSGGSGVSASGAFGLSDGATPSISTYWG